MPGARGGVGAATWFEDTFGFKEQKYEETRAHFEFRDKTLVSKANSKSFHVGPFDVVSLEDLRARLASLEAKATSGRSSSDKLVFKNIVGDVRELHTNSANAGAVFQVASQFNCLEMNEPGARPEDGVTRYCADATQGPACSLACPAGTVFRNYFVNGTGQGNKHQVDCLSGVGALVSNAEEGYWRMTNGYCLPTKAGSIARLSKNVEADDSLAEGIRSKLQVGVHWDTEVRKGQQRVCQVFCSALPVAYAKSTPSKEWQPFAQCVLDAAFDATLTAAAVLAAGRGGRVKVYLTPVGGGAFGNRSQWICDALHKALLRHATRPLDVMLVSFATLPRGPYVTLEKSWASSLPSSRSADAEGTEAPRRPSNGNSTTPPTDDHKLPALNVATSGRTSSKPASQRAARPGSASKLPASPGSAASLTAASTALKTDRGKSGSLADRLTASFAALDSNGDGVIDEQELAAVLTVLDPKVFTTQMVRKLFKAADADSDGFIHYAEFVAWVCDEKTGIAGALLDIGAGKGKKGSPKNAAGKEAEKPIAVVPVAPPAPPANAKTGRRPQGRLKEGRIVMGRYSMAMTDDAFMGEGTSSICRKGIDTQTGKTVAIKVYKAKEHGQQVALVKFRRQIQVLLELMQPFERPSDPKLWNEELATASPAKIFMQLLDYSKQPDGKPGPDPTDGQMYVVTEIAQFSLKDYIKKRRDEKRPMSKDTVRSLVKAVMLVTAGLHAKGLVHLDLKPENLMIFDGVLKLIDVDGCVKIGTSISIEDESLSFSPVYCSPEWANFLIDEDEEEQRLTAAPALDVWSIGMTLMELVTLDPVLKPQYASFFRHGREREEASFLFFDWLSSLQKPPVPRAVKELDTKLQQLLAEHLLVCNPNKRRSLAEALEHPYLSRATPKRTGEGGSAERRSTRTATGPLREDASGNDISEVAQAQAAHRGRVREEDTSDKAVHQGTLYKLNTGGDPKDPAQWLQRDIWISTTGDLCYFSLKDNKRLKLMDNQLLNVATVSKFEGGTREHGFKVQSMDHRLVFAVDSSEEARQWMEAIERVKADNVSSMKLGEGMAKELRRLRFKVRNRRQALDDKQKTGEGYKPKFKCYLWKLKADGDITREGDWYRREMWLSKNGSLIYWSEKEERELVYYTAPDVAHATITVIANSPATSPKSWRFQVKLALQGGVEFSPGEFAADSESERDAWLAEFAKFRI